MADLEQLLTEARQRGLLGPAPIADQIAHALALLAGIGPDEAVLDLGSGGGLPGLAAAAVGRPGRLVLLDAQHRRAEWLRHAVSVLLAGDDHVEVVEGRAEDLARVDGLRGGFDVVVARSFGPPPVVAECARGFLRDGGRLIVSEPPEATAERWPAAGLAALGLLLERRESTPIRRVLIRAVGDPPDGVPRRSGLPAKRPLF